MKKFLALLLAVMMVLSLAACGKAAEKDIFAKGEGVMTHEQFIAAEEGSRVTVEAFVQGHQSWWDNKITVYAQDKDGGYFFYDMACSEADAAKLVPGTKIKVTGDKGVWAGQIEVMDATFEFEDGSWVAPALDIAKLLGTPELESHMTEFVSVSGAKIADKGNGAAFFYNWDGSGADGDDLYFDIEINGGTYTFVVRRYLTAPGSEVYEAVKNLKVGDTVDIEGFLYWYEGPQPHISSITVK
ncbi:MAG: hypothetical protein IJH48_03365 [Oscillospiraceae bacterium]|nr:hypothetical protein [Oscillospiraceae bacterium]